MEKNKIRRLLYTIKESAFPKDEIFLNSINLIKINLSNNIENINEAFCLAKGEFFNFKKSYKLEKYVIFGSQFQLNFYGEVQEIFIDVKYKFLGLRCVPSSIILAVVTVPVPIN